MLAMFDDYVGMEWFFLLCALIGGTLFMIRFVLQFVGGDTDMDADGDIDIDMDGDVDVGDGGDTDISFKLLSLQGITSFALMFGLVGLAMMRQSGQNEIRALVAATVAGSVTFWLMQWIFNKAKVLQSSGNIKMKNAIGKEGDVYLTIHPHGTGKVRVSVQNHLKVWNATTGSNQEIKTGERVRVTGVVSGNVLVVEKLTN
ncbi:MAG: NfeD family protein [Sedimentisphaerales bacterium]|nr:NfeD family protein [Sedimentisphaerales bacterium]